MKLFHYLTCVAFIIVPLNAKSTETANATLTCYSLQVQRGNESRGNYFLDLSSVNGGLNGELAPDFLSSGYSHTAYLILQDELFGDTLSGVMGVDIPSAGDGNHDGYDDFWQVSQGVTNLPTSGAYSLQVYGNGTISAVWNRPAGSSYGTCALTMPLMPFDTVTFYHAFQVLEYVGPLNYTPGTNTVNGTLNLAQIENVGAMTIGPVTFIKSATDKFNTLTLQPGYLTNESQQTLAYIKDTYSRDTRWPTNYYGLLEYIDPSNPTALYPYGTWIFSIDDANDSNGNGIPDFSDTPSSTSIPRTPQLQLTQNGTSLTFTLQGDTGFTDDIQTVSDLGSTNWQTVTSVAITNNSQTVSLPMPAGTSSFWRIRVH